MSYNRPKVEGRDDVTGEPLSKRPDDNPVCRPPVLKSMYTYPFFFRRTQEIFARRLKKFYEITSPLITYFASRASPSTKVVTLSGKTSDEIWPKLDEVVASFPIRPQNETRFEAREREREKSLRESMGLNAASGHDGARTKKSSM